MARVGNRERYRLFCEERGTEIPLFLQYWWMEAVCEGKEWDVILTEKDDEIVGAQPFLFGKKLGMRYVLQPELTMFTGPWVKRGAEGWAMESLAKQLAERRDMISLFRCRPGMEETERYEEYGFERRERWTYRFPKIEQLEKMMARASKLRRRDFERNGERLIVERSMEAEKFCDFYFAAQQSLGRKEMVRSDVLRRVVRKAIERGQGMAMGLRDQRDEMQAAVFMPYDEKCAYLVLLARRNDSPRNAMSYLIWRAIEEMRERTEAFDFEGGNEASIGAFYASFGAEKTMYVEYKKCRCKLIEKMLGI